MKYHINCDGNCYNCIMVGCKNRDLSLQGHAEKLKKEISENLR